MPVGGIINLRRGVSGADSLKMLDLTKGEMQAVDEPEVSKAA